MLKCFGCPEYCIFQSNFACLLLFTFLFIWCVTFYQKETLSEYCFDVFCSTILKIAVFPVILMIIYDFLQFPRCNFLFIKPVKLFVQKLIVLKNKLFKYKYNWGTLEEASIGNWQLNLWFICRWKIRTRIIGQRVQSAHEINNKFRQSIRLWIIQVRFQKFIGRYWWQHQSLS